MEHYLETSINCALDKMEWIIAELADLGFEGFIETEEGVTVYIPQDLYNKTAFVEVMQKYEIDETAFVTSTVAPQNWNAQWEANYEPIIVANRLAVLAPFHQPQKAYEQTIVIQPKNTFGTGHHETTQLVLELMLNQNFNNKQVFDYGCGTGVLGLMALKLGAANIIGNDIDAWCVDNIAENKMLNNLTDFEFRLGNLSVLHQAEKFDVVLANINKNILLNSFASIILHMQNNALLLISGFYETDLNDIVQKANEVGLQLNLHKEKNNWCAALLKYNP